jgi:hypothetical protein
MSKKLIDFQVCSKPDTFNRRVVLATADGDEIHRDLFDVNSASMREKFVNAVWGKTNPGGYVSPDDGYDYDPNATDDKHPLEWMAEAMIQRAVDYDIDAAIGGSVGKPKFNLITSRELSALEIVVTELIVGILVQGQPCIMLGAQKTLKTTFAMALAFALATGRPFLDKFHTNGTHRVLMFSGESGLATLKEILRRICDAAFVDMAELDDSLIISDTIPKIANLLHIDELRRIFKQLRTEVVIVDPLYLALDTDGREGSVFAMGQMLSMLSALCQEMGITLVLLHHLKKGNGETKGHAELSDASWSGCAEFARQWIILNRRAKYEPGTGTHELWMNVGGSAGVNGLYSVTVDEGCGVGNRHWEVSIEYASEMRDREAEESKAEANERKQRLRDEHVYELRQAFATFPDGETEKTIREATTLNGSNFKVALSSLRRRGEIQEVKMPPKENGRSYPGIKLITPGRINGTSGHIGTNEGACPIVPLYGEPSGQRDSVPL